MKRPFAWGAAGVAMLLLALPFAGAAGASTLTGSTAATGSAAGSTAANPPRSLNSKGLPNAEGNPNRGTPPTVPVPVPPVGPGPGSSTHEPPAALETQAAHETQDLSCPGAATGTVAAAPSNVSPHGVLGTTSADLASFADAFNDIRADNCLQPVPLANFRYDSCMETRLFWMAEDPSTDPASAWGHVGTQRSDGVPSVGCDGNLAGGFNNSGQTVASKWWTSTGHRTSLYKPSYTGSMNAVCIHFAMTHGGVPDEPAAFTRAAAYWGAC